MQYRHFEKNTSILKTHPFKWTVYMLQMNLFKEIHILINPVLETEGKLLP